MVEGMRLWCLAILFFVVACSFEGGFTGADKKGDVVLGFVGPLSGDAAVFGIVERNAIALAVDEINARGGLTGHNVSVIYEDGKCNAKDALTAAKKLIDVDRVKIILSDCSAETLAIAPLAEENKVIVMTAWATHPNISQAGDYVFRMSYSDADTARVAAQTIAKAHKAVGLIYEENEYSVDLKDLFVQEFEKRAGSVILESYAPSETDVRTQLTKLLANNVTAVFVDPNTPASGKEILRELHELGYRGDVFANFFGASAANMKEAEGLVFFSDPIVQESKEKLSLFDKYEEKYGVVPEFEYALAARYDSIYLLKQAIERGGTDPNAIKEYLYHMPEFTGVLGTYRFDSNGDIVGVRPSVKKLVNGQVIMVTDF